MDALHAQVTGFVQGVFFRAAIKERADALGLVGYAKNVPDGSVEVAAEGEREQLEELLTFLKSGSELSRVDDVHFEFTDAEGVYSSFHTL